MKNILKNLFDMLTTQKKDNVNYLAKVVLIDNLKPIEGADRIQIAVIDFQDVIVSKSVKQGDIMVYFPVECVINKDFLSTTNVFRKPELNADKESKGFFEEKGRVKAIKMMKGIVKSMGYVVPFDTVIEWADLARSLKSNFIGESFDTINGKLLVEKYQVKKREPRNKQGKEPKISRLVDGQIHLHIDTENLRRNAHKIKPNDMISITYKTHGTSWWVSNVLVKRKLSRLEKVSKFFGGNVQELEHDVVYGSRRVVKNKAFEDPKGQDHYFGYDLWEDIKNHVGDKLPKGYTVYGEMLGYDRNGGAIQKGYDYGCKPNGTAFSDFEPQSKLEVYRVTYTNPDGIVSELDYPQLVQFCDRMGLKTPYLFFWGKAGKWLEKHKAEQGLFLTEYQDDRDWQEAFVTELEKAYNDKDCFMCNNKVPEEGIVVRKEDMFSCESYKLKSFSFLEWESKELDKGESDIESEN